MKVTCPSCGSQIDIDAKTDPGEIIVCPECGAELEVVKRGKGLDVELIEEFGEAEFEVEEPEEMEDFD